MGYNSSRQFVRSLWICDMSLDFNEAMTASQRQDDIYTRRVYQIRTHLNLEAQHCPDALSRAQRCVDKDDILGMTTYSHRPCSPRL